MKGKLFKIYEGLIASKNMEADKAKLELEGKYYYSYHLPGGSSVDFKDLSEENVKYALNTLCKKLT